MPMARTQHFLTGATTFFTVTAPLEPEALATPLEHEAPAAPLGPDAPIAMCVIVTAAVGRDMFFFLSFTGLTEATFASDGRFRLAFPRDVEAFIDSSFFFLDTLGHLTGAFLVASTFLFFEALVMASKSGTGLGDEDINTSATIIPSVGILGPIRRLWAQQLNHQVN
jgi:hypothetical protein